jgi:phosphoglycolate phosphatase-like HAD superfamily hydrolase
MSIRGVIFDLDGTLVDTNRYHVEAWRRAFAAAGYDVPAEKIAARVGMGGDQLMPAVIDKDAAERDGKKRRSLYKLGLPPDECAMVGDTPFDVEACRHAGVRCWAVASGGCHTAEQLRAAGATTVWNDPADVLQHLDQALSG